MSPLGECKNLDNSRTSSGRAAGGDGESKDAAKQAVLAVVRQLLLDLEDEVRTLIELRRPSKKSPMSSNRSLSHDRPSGP